MDNLVLNPTSTAQWHHLVQDAAFHAGLQLDEELESYLVFLLMRFVEQPHLSNQALALEYLRSQLHGRGQQHETLQAVGDKCLLFAGLFPGHAQRKRVRISYFVDLGQTAYHHLSLVSRAALGELYGTLRNEFVVLMEVLQASRELTGANALLPLEAMELWQDTQSQRAYACLKDLSDALPIVDRDDTLQ
ncbi:MAG: hypothetical protein CMF50_02325 [Legionellales bacterium]|nr:hypothetical protein [Legionellales bacterium]|tara:strand:- start:10829 stop:11398 length:570 start_codon:yes stop_codon:yes gene_type:complete